MSAFSFAVYLLITMSGDLRTSPISDFAGTSVTASSLYVLEHEHVFHRPTIVVILEPKAVFDSVKYGVP